MIRIRCALSFFVVVSLSLLGVRVLSAPNTCLSLRSQGIGVASGGNCLAPEFPPPRVLSTGAWEHGASHTAGR